MTTQSHSQPFASPQGARPVIAVIGGGPAGLAAAEAMALGGCKVVLIERMPSVGRKFLMAGRSGLNLTHAEPLDDFISRYGPQADWLRPVIEAYPPQAVRDWAQGLGEACFTGSSGRVFPVAMKASPLLRAWLVRLANLGVSIRTRCLWRGWNAGSDHIDLALEEASGHSVLRVQACVMALGGSSWQRLGSDGAWSAILASKGIELAPFLPANCGFRTDWNEEMRARFAGQPIKGVSLSLGAYASRGDMVVTAHGIEGGVVYSLSAAIRDAIAAGGDVDLRLDLRPEFSATEIAARLSRVRPRESNANKLRKALRLPPVALAILREAFPDGSTQDPLAMARRIKSVPLRLLGPDTLDRAISVAGGVSRANLDGSFMLREHPGIFVAGEMLDWEAPTGGYLLQACFSTGHAAGKAALAWLAKQGNGGYPSMP